MTDTILTRRRVIALAWPIIFANALIPMVGVIDTAVIGLSGDATDIGAVALGSTVFSVFYGGTYFLRMGVTGLTAQALGADDTEESQRIVLRALTIAFVLGFTALLFKVPIDALAFNILQGSDSVESKGSAYLDARFYGAPAAIGLFAITGWLIGAGRTRTALVVQALLAVINGALDIWFVVGFGWGPKGVAAGTAMAEWAAFIVGIALIWRIFRRDRQSFTAAFALAPLFNPAAMKKLLGVNFDLFLRSMTLVVGFSWFVNAGARQGDVVLAANQVLLQFIVVWAYVLDAFAFTAEAETGRAFGQKSLPAFRRAIRLTSEFAVVSAIGFSIITLILGDIAIHTVVADLAVREYAMRFLPFCAAVPILGVAAWQLDGVFTGAMYTIAMRNAAIIAVLIYLLADIALSPLWGNAGVWIAFLGYYVVRALTLMVFYPGLERAMAQKT